MLSRKTHGAFDQPKVLIFVYYFCVIMLSLLSWCGTLCEQDRWQVFSKLGGSRLGSIDKHRLGLASKLASKLESKLASLDTSTILRNIQREASCFFKHPCRSFRHIALFVGAVRLTPDGFTYHANTKSDSRVVDILAKATRLDVMWNEDDSYACQVINACAVNFIVNQEGTSIQASPSFECRQDVDNDSLVRDHLWVPQFELVNFKEVIDYYPREDYKRLTTCVDFPATFYTHSITSIHVYYRAKALGKIVGFPFVETFSIHRPGGLAQLDEQDLHGLAKTRLKTLELILWSCLPKQIGLMTKLSALKVEHAKSPDQEAQQVYKFNDSKRARLVNQLDDALVNWFWIPRKHSERTWTSFATQRAPDHQHLVDKPTCRNRRAC